MITDKSIVEVGAVYGWNFLCRLGYHLPTTSATLSSRSHGDSPGKLCHLKSGIKKMDWTDVLDCVDDLEMTKHALYDCYAIYRFSGSVGKLMLLNAILEHLLRLTFVYPSPGRQWGGGWNERMLLFSREARSLIWNTSLKRTHGNKSYSKTGWNF